MNNKTKITKTTINDLICNYKVTLNTYTDLLNSLDAYEEDRFDSTVIDYINKGNHKFRDISKLKI